METLRAFLSGCMASLSFSSPKGSAEALPEVFCPLQNLPAPSHTANICRIRRLPTLTERLCEIAGNASARVDFLRSAKLICLPVPRPRRTFRLPHPQPLDALSYARFTGIPTFMRLPRIAQPEELDVALVGVPFDGGTTYRPGPR